MRPSFSIIFFTVMSGAGYGLWMIVGVALALFWPEVSPGKGLTLMRYPGLYLYGLAAGFVLVSSGLVSSLWHLGKPARAWRAFSQWRSSWLSREGVAALFTFIPAIGIAVTVAHDAWVMRTVDNEPIIDGTLWFSATAFSILGTLLAIGSMLTVFCTGNIYACLKPVRAWHNRYVVAGYLLLGIYSGGLLAWALCSLPNGHMRGMRWLLAGIAVAALAGALLKHFYWRFIHREPDATTGDATGLKSLGVVRSFEQPHTEENYLTHEMGFRIARKHSRKLRRIALVAGFLVPAVLALLALFVPGSWRAGAWIALVPGMAGIFVERWLFFAEARHTVMLYYGAR